MAVTARLALGCIPPSLKGLTVSLSIDGTMVEKYGVKFQACSKLFGHASHNGSTYLNGHHVPFQPADGTIYLSIPLGCRLWTKELSKLEPAAQGRIQYPMAFPVKGQADVGVPAPMGAAGAILHYPGQAGGCTLLHGMP